MESDNNEIIRELIKANAEDLYKDAAQPSLRVLGKPLAQCMSLFATPVGRMAEIFERNIHRYIDKLSDFKEEELVAPDTRILVPILERMRFTDQEKVAEYYAEILATASKKEHANKVMVTFIEILNRLTADEIKIIEYIASPSNNVLVPDLTDDELKQSGLPKGTMLLNITGSLPFLEIRLETKGKIGFKLIMKNFNCLEENVEFDSVDNISSYIDNMISLGLVIIREDHKFSISKIYNHLEKHEKINVLKQAAVVNNQEIKLIKGRIDLTDLGRRLLSLCTSKSVSSK